MAHAGSDVRCKCTGIYRHVEPIHQNDQHRSDLPLPPCAVLVEMDEWTDRHAFHYLYQRDPYAMKITDLLQRLQYKCECEKPLFSLEMIDVLRTELRNDNICEIVITATGIATIYWTNNKVLNYIWKSPISAAYRTLLSKGSTQCRSAWL